MKTLERIIAYGMVKYCKHCLKKEWTPEIHERFEKRYNQKLSIKIYYRYNIKYKDAYGEIKTIFGKVCETREEAKEDTEGKALKYPYKYAKKVKGSYEKINNVDRILVDKRKEEIKENVEGQKELKQKPKPKTKKPLISKEQIKEIAEGLKLAGFGIEDIAKAIKEIIGK